MPTPVGMIVVQVDVAFQSAAPSYSYLANVLARSLTDELATEDPAKVAGIHWAGTGPRVVRQTNQSHAPGGTVFAVAMLVADDPSVITRLGPRETQALLNIVAGSAGATIDNALSVGSSATARVSAYNPTVNGPVDFWTGGQSQQTRTRELFPTTSIVNGVSTDQNENPYGPNTADVTPTQPSGTSPKDWTDLVHAITIAAGAIGAVWLLVTISNAYKSTRETFATAQRVRSLVRGNPSDLESGHARIQRLIAAYVKRTIRDQIYVPNSAIPIGGGEWRFYTKDRWGQFAVGVNGRPHPWTVSHAELVKAVQS